MTPTRRLILLVDDDEANLLTLGALLEMEDFDVETAASCATARARLASGTPYAAVLLDGSLRDGAGLDLVPTIRLSLPRAAILLVSGTLRELSEPAVVDATVRKGEAFIDLVEKLRKLLPT